MSEPLQRLKNVALIEVRLYVLPAILHARCGDVVIVHLKLDAFHMCVAFTETLRICMPNASPVRIITYNQIVTICWRSLRFFGHVARSDERVDHTRAPKRS